MSLGSDTSQMSVGGTSLTLCFHLDGVQQKGSSSGGKKKLSGFMLFSKENRPKIKEENPDITFGQIGKKLGEMWRALDEKEKQAYKDRKE